MPSLSRTAKIARAIEDAMEVRGMMKTGSVLVLDDKLVRSAMVPGDAERWESTYVCKAGVDPDVVASAAEDDAEMGMLKGELKLRSYASIPKDRDVMLAFARDVLMGLPWQLVELRNEIQAARKNNRGMKSFQAAGLVFKPPNAGSLAPLVNEVSSLIDAFESNDEDVIRKAGIVDDLGLPDQERMSKIIGRFEKWVTNGLLKRTGKLKSTTPA